MSATYSRCCHCTAILTISDTCAFCHHPSCPTCHASSTPLPGTHTNHFDIATMTPPSPLSPLSPLASPFALGRNLSMKARMERERREMEGRQRMRRMSAERDEAVRARRVAREAMGGMGSA